MLQMDKYQIRYHKFFENIISSSRLSLTLYFALRKMFETAKEHINYRYQQIYHFYICFSNKNVWLHVYTFNRFKNFKLSFSYS